MLRPIHYLIIVIVLLTGANPALPQDTPASTEGYEDSYSGGTYTDFVETTYDDPDWVLVTSEFILRANICIASDPVHPYDWYDKVFEPCYNYNRYWKLAPYAETGRAFTMLAVKAGDSFDSLYVREGFEFQLYYNTEEPNDLRELEPATPYLNGPKYVSLDYWEPLAPDGFEPGTYFVPGGKGELANYSIIIFNYPLKLYKTDNADPNGVLPEDSITYEITYNPNGHNDTNVVLTDYLPIEVDYDEPDPNYDIDNHTYTWDIGDLDANDPNATVTLTVKINELAEPNGVIMNYCEIEGDNFFAARRAYINVGCWNPSVIYVDKDVNGYNTGMSWQYAYTYLQDALKRASDGYGIEIWVAEGTYNPLTDPYDETDYFAIADGVDVYGGFAGYETSLNQRNWIENETILDGGNAEDSTPTVSLYSNSGSVLDGLTITSEERAVYCHSSTLEIINCIIKDSEKGVYCYDSSVEITDSNILGSVYGINSHGSDITINNCLIKGNSDYGIYSYDCDLVVSNCLIDKNPGYGIYNFRTLSSLITNSIIRRNTNRGIYFNDVDYGADIKIKNNWIHDNISDGIYIYDADPAVIIRNNTIVGNGGCGIKSEDADYVTISNCILWANISGQLLNCTANYSCIDGGGSGTGNINSDPCFINSTDPNDYHLGPNSLCIDTGDPDPNYTGQTDIHGEPRVIDVPGKGDGVNDVDMGGDEYFWSRADYNKDGIVNFLDYAIFANAWQSENANISLDDDSYVNMADLYHFRKDWLWQASWEKWYSYGCTGFGGDGGFGEFAQSEQEIEQQQAEPAEVDTEGLVEFLEAIWEQDEGLKDYFTEEQWQQFVESVKSD